ncbi:hypothetical protein PVAND_001753 [Polypedilum vanderplanki]|uniref:Uncharacterized protein n=1 Tax=Polypedilum vanderplanki TaxID=319348 RepID=A0A9J6BPB8_POLVA|nr:hypothetical protein PVAND_001753 [Polypedilum vanderplanki]
MLCYCFVLIYPEFGEKFLGSTQYRSPIARWRRQQSTDIELENFSFTIQSICDEFNSNSPPPSYFETIESSNCNNA